MLKNLQSNHYALIVQGWRYHGRYECELGTSTLVITSVCIWWFWQAVVRAEAAFKSIGGAFGVLSNKAKKYLLSSKRNEVPEMTSHASESVPPTFAQAPHDALTFWMTFPFCKIQDLYVRAKRGCRQLCQNCHTVFFATDMNVTLQMRLMPSRLAQFLMFQDINLKRVHESVEWNLAM